jgi:hypothetical protein
LISISMSSSISGDTNTAAKEVWRRLPESKATCARDDARRSPFREPAVGVVADDVHARALDAGNFAGRLVDDLGLEAAPFAPLQVHAQEHLRPVLRLRAARPALTSR